MRVVVADDSVLLREGVVRLLEDRGFDVVAQAGDAEDLLRKVNAHKPDVAVVDIRMPPTNTDDGLRAAIEIRERFPGTGVLVLSAYVEEAYAIELVSETPSGVGYLLKDRVADVAEFADALARVAAGGTALDPEVVSRLLAASQSDSRLAHLTARERAWCIADNAETTMFIYPADSFKMREVSFRAPLPGYGRFRDVSLTLSARNFWTWKNKDFPIFDAEMTAQEGMEQAVRAIGEQIPAPASFTASLRAVF
jgi:DNA-binding NarL/FixJ family response regulator